MSIFTYWNFQPRDKIIVIALGNYFMKECIVTEVCKPGTIRIQLDEYGQDHMLNRETLYKVDLESDKEQYTYVAFYPHEIVPKSPKGIEVSNDPMVLLELEKVEWQYLRSGE